MGKGPDFMERRGGDTADWGHTTKWVWGPVLLLVTQLERVIQNSPDTKVSNASGAQEPRVPPGPGHQPDRTSELFTVGHDFTPCLQSLKIGHSYAVYLVLIFSSKIYFAPTVRGAEDMADTVPLFT